MVRKPDLVDELAAADPSRHAAILKQAAERRRERFWFNGYLTGTFGYAVLPHAIGADPSLPGAMQIVLGIMLAWLPGAVVGLALAFVWPMFLADLREPGGRI